MSIRKYEFKVKLSELPPNLTINYLLLKKTKITCFINYQHTIILIKIKIFTLFIFG